jgi:CshA-type fibril repeat protein
MVNVVANDKAGHPSAPLRPDSVVLRDPADGKEKKTVTVPDEGTFVAGEGTVAFTPAKGFVGTTRTLVYRVTDANGTSGTALLDITVAGPQLAKAAPDTAGGTPGNPVAVNPLLNDSGAIQPATVCLRTADGSCTKSVTNGVGTWSVGSDGTVMLKPVAAFTGTAKVTYERTDSTGETVAAPVKFTVGARPTDVGTDSADSADSADSTANVPRSGGPPSVLLTLGALVVGLGTALVALSRTRR